jgi:hypothetical protein
MKMKLLKTLSFFLLVFILAVPLVNASAGAGQEIIPGGKLVLGGVFTLESGQTLAGDMLVMGGAVNLQAGSTVTGNILMLGGNLQANGTIGGSLFSLGGLVQMSDTTVVNGDVGALGGSIQGAQEATINGQVITENNTSFPLVLPGNMRGSFPNFSIRTNPLWDMLWLFAQSFLWAALAVVVILFAPNPTRRVGETASTQPLISGGLGLLTAILAPILMLIVAITLIGIPVALLALAAFLVAWAFGLIAIGIEIGERLAKAARSDWALPVSAALGTFILTLIANTLGKIIPCIGWLAPFLVGIIGLGAVLLTRFGSRPYPTEVVVISSSEPPVSEP